jgi:hypothetical protein
VNTLHAHTQPPPPIEGDRLPERTGAGLRAGRARPLDPPTPSPAPRPCRLAVRTGNPVARAGRLRRPRIREPRCRSAAGGCPRTRPPGGATSRIP